MRCIVAAVLALALVGCASPGAMKIDQGKAAADRGDYATAEQLTAEGLRMNPSDQDRATGINNLGHYAMMRGDRDAALNAFTLAARMGDPTAVRNLETLGAPVPASDLAPHEASDERAQEGVLILLGSMADAMGGKPGKDKAVRCVSQDRGSNTYTTCK